MKPHVWKQYGLWRVQGYSFIGAEGWTTIGAMSRFINRRAE